MINGDPRLIVVVVGLRETHRKAPKKTPTPCRGNGKELAIERELKDEGVAFNEVKAVKGWFKNFNGPPKGDTFYF